MAIRKTIAIIGATGKMGSAITRALAGKNNELLLMARDQQKINNLVDVLKKEYPSTSIHVINCSKEACWEADIIILAVPAEVEIEVVKYIKEVITQKIVVSISPVTTIEELQHTIPNSKIVKAFYSNTPDELISTKTDHEIDSVIMGEDGEGLEEVSELIRSVGLKPVVKYIHSTAESNEILNKQ